MYYEWSADDLMRASVESRASPSPSLSAPPPSIPLVADALSPASRAVQRQLTTRSNSLLGRNKSVYQQRNLGTIRAHKKEKQQKVTSSGEMILRILRMQCVLLSLSLFSLSLSVNGALTEHSRADTARARATSCRRRSRRCTACTPSSPRSSSSSRSAGRCSGRAARTAGWQAGAGEEEEAAREEASRGGRSSGPSSTSERSSLLVLSVCYCLYRAVAVVGCSPPSLSCIARRSRTLAPCRKLASPVRGRVLAWARELFCGDRTEREVERRSRRLRVDDEPAEEEERAARRLAHSHLGTDGQSERVYLSRSSH